MRPGRRQALIVGVVVLLAVGLVTWGLGLALSAVWVSTPSSNSPSPATCAEFNRRTRIDLQAGAVEPGVDRELLAAMMSACR